MLCVHRDQAVILCNAEHTNLQSQKETAPKYLKAFVFRQQMDDSCLPEVCKVKLEQLRNAPSGVGT